MPPRRSSRAASTSLEVPPASEAAQIKRKRGQTAELDTEAKENVAKPLSRTRRSTRSSVGPPSKSRTASRSKPSLPDVAESDDEAQSEAPPLKKARPSTDSKSIEELEDDPVATIGKDERPKRGRRKNAKDSHMVSEMETEESSKLSADRRSSRTAGSRSKIALDEDDGDQEADAPSANDEEEEAKPAFRKGRISKAQAARKTTKRAVKPPVVDESDDDLEPPPPAQSKSVTRKVNGAQQQSPQRGISYPKDDMEEKSLFEPPPISAPPASVPPVSLDQSQGPQSRLVIHKMALVNFKSYAGRQEIGPFHKVSQFGPVIQISHLFSLSPPLLVLTVLVNRTPLMRCYLFSAIARQK